MELVGSRAKGTADEFSDWDYQLSDAADVDAVLSRCLVAVAWRGYERGPIRIVTLLNDAGVLEDYTGLANLFSGRWEQFAHDATTANIHEYWIFVFKGLKALDRGYSALHDLGIEMSCGLVRDIALATRHGITQYKDFYNFRQVADKIDDRELSQVTGLPYRNPEERLHKMRALNQLMVVLTPALSTDANRLFEARLNTGGQSISG